MAVDPARSGLSRLTGRLERHHAWVALGLYAALALVIQHQVLDHIAGGCTCVGTDAAGFMWALKWWPHALAHGLNPFASSLIWVPDVTNTASTTTTPLPALLAAPLTWLAGPVVSYNVWILIAPVIGAICAERLCFQLCRRALPAMLGGWVYGFSAYETGQIQGHLNLVFTFALPLLLLIGLRWWDQTLSPRRCVGYGAVVVAAQLLSGTEMLLTTTLALVVIGTCLLGLVPELRPRAPQLGLIGLGAYALCGVICSPFIYSALTGPKLGTALSGPLGADLGSFVVPTTNLALGGAHFASLSATFAAGSVETGTYLGLPLVLVIALFGGGWRRSRLVRVTLAAGVVMTIWALGRHLQVFGHQLIPLPWDLLGRLPVLDQLLPVRVGAYLSLGAAVALADWLSARPPVTAAGGGLAWLGAWPWLLAVLVLVSLFPNTSGASFSTTYPIPAFFTHGNDQRYLRPHEVVLTLPFGMTPLWQATAGMYFDTAGGDFFPPPDYESSPAVQQMEGLAPFSPTILEPALRAFLTAHHVSAVIVQDAPAAGPWINAVNGLGLRAQTTDGVLLYPVS